MAVGLSTVIFCLVDVTVMVQLNVGFYVHKFWFSETVDGINR